MPTHETHQKGDEPVLISSVWNGGVACNPTVRASRRTLVGLLGPQTASRKAPSKCLRIQCCQTYMGEREGRGPNQITHQGFIND